MFSSNCCFLICIQVSQEAGKVVWYSRLFKNFPQFYVIHIVKGFSIVNEAEIDVLWEFPCFFYDPTFWQISGSSASSISSLYIWKSSVHVLLKPSLKNSDHYLARMLNKYNWMVDWTFFGIALLWDWNENIFSSPVAIAEYPKSARILTAALRQHHRLGFEITQLEFHQLY